MRTAVFVCILAVALFSKLWASADAKRGGLFHRPNREPGSRTNHFRKGEAMRTQTTQQSLEAERVWGVEALDPLQQRAWAETIWQKLQNKVLSRKLERDSDKLSQAAALAPVFLQFGPTAEPAAIRALNTLARIARTEAPHATVYLVAPDTDPLLAPPPVRCESLFLIHRANRFVNWKEWLQEARAFSYCRIVMTVSQEESAPLLEYLHGEVITIPEVAQDYCEQRRREVLTKSLGGELPGAASLSRWEQILVEAGIAEVALPLSLLARHLALDSSELIDTMQTTRLRSFLYWLASEAKKPSLVAFKGSYLAKKIAPAIVSGEYHALFALLMDVDPQSPQERAFSLGLLTALHAQGCDTMGERLQHQYTALFTQIRRLVDNCPERQAWASFERRGCCSNYTTPAKV